MEKQQTKTKNNKPYNKYSTKTPFEWATEFNLVISKFNGQFDAHSFNDVQVSLEEFLNKIAHCEITKPDGISSRREINNLKQELRKKLE